MSNKIVFFALIAICLVLVALTGGSAYMANQLLTKQSAKLVSLKIQQKELEQQKTSLTRAQSDIEKYSTLESIAKTIVPQDKDQAEAVREIVNIAQSSGITLSGITFLASTLGQTKAVPAGNGVSGTAVPKSSSALTQVTPVVGIPGVYDLQISVTQSVDTPVSYNNFIQFLSKLEANRRTAQVATVSIIPDSKKHGQLTFTLSLDEYLKP